MKLIFRCPRKTSINRCVASRGWFYVVLVIACFGFSRTTRAVNPPPDGGYPGENTAEGTSALLHVKGGTKKTTVNWASLGFDVTGNLNTTVGDTTADRRSENRHTASGAVETEAAMMPMIQCPAMLAYIANLDSNDVSVIDTSNDTVLATVPVGSAPFGVAVKPDGTRVYVTTDSDNTVSVIDTSNNTVVATVGVGLQPTGVA